MKVDKDLNRVMKHAQRGDEEYSDIKECFWICFVAFVFGCILIGLIVAMQ